MDVRAVVMHTLMAMHFFILLLFFHSGHALAASDAETKKTYIEDIFIWRMSDELKLTATEEKKFTEIHKSLNKKKAELNKAIQDQTQNLAELSRDSDKVTEGQLKSLRKNIKDYNQISIEEFDSMKKLLGIKRFANYLQIKSELTTKVKSLMTGEKPPEKDKNEVENVKLPPPQVIIEKNE